MDNIQSLPYRNNVCCVLFKKDKYLLVQLVGWNHNWWKFPQGGIEEGETVSDAVKRELFEELNIINIRFIKIFDYNNKYDWTESIILKHNSKWRGQSQTFCLVEFIGNESEIKLDKKEIKKSRWVTKKKLLNLIDNISKFNGNYKTIIQRVVRQFINFQK